MLAMQVSLRLRCGITVSLRWQCESRFGFAVASQRLHAGNSNLARHRSSIATSSRCHCRPRFGFAMASQRLHAGYAGLATASQWHRSIFTLAMQVSLRFRWGIAASSRCQRRPCYGNAVASQRLHAGNAGFSSASQWLRRVFTLAMQISLRLRCGIAASSRCQRRPCYGNAVASQRLHAVNEGFASASLWHHSVFTLAIQASLRLCSYIAEYSCWQCEPRSASQRHRSVFTLSM